jgi:hypothetical protein
MFSNTLTSSSSSANFKTIGVVSWGWGSGSSASSRALCYWILQDSTAWVPNNGSSATRTHLQNCIYRCACLA